MHRKTAVLFDFHGTLAEMAREHSERRQDLCAELSRRGIHRTYYQVRTAERAVLILDAPFDGLVDALSVARRIAALLRISEPQVIDWLADEQRSREGDWELLPGAREALELAREAARCAVVTTVSGYVVRGVFEREGIVGVPAFGPAELGAVKPDPLVYRHAAELIGCAPADCLMVGDSEVNDLGPAREVGMEAVLVGDGAMTLAELCRRLARAGSEMGR